MAQKDTRLPNDTIHLGASELAAAIKAGDLSAKEVVDARISHIENVNPGLNAVVIPLFDEVRAQAKLADDARASPAPSPISRWRWRCSPRSQ